MDTVDNEAATNITAVIAILLRPDVNPVIKAEKLKRLLAPPFNLTLDQIRQRAVRLEEQQAINRAVKVLRQPKEILDFLRVGSLLEGHAVFLDRIPQVAKRIRMAKKAVKQQWNLDRTWHAVEFEIDPRYKREKIRGFEQAGFQLSWDGDEIVLAVRSFRPKDDTVNDYLSELKEALQFFLDDNDRDVELAEEKKEESPLVLLPPAPKSTRTHSAAEVLGRVLQLPPKPSKLS